MSTAGAPTTSAPTDALTRIADPARSGLDGAIFVPLLRLLASGRPATIGDVAQAAALTVDEVERRLTAAPDTEYDDAGRIVGQALTLRPTRHRFTIDGRTLYTWCALDTVMFPALLGAAADVSSTSPATGGEIRLRVTPGAVIDLEPATAVVTLTAPDDLTAVRSSFCNDVNFYGSTAEAADWLAAHPTGRAVPVARAQKLGLAVAARWLEQAAGSVAG